MCRDDKYYEKNKNGNANGRGTTTYIRISIPCCIYKCLCQYKKGKESIV